MFRSVFCLLILFATAASLSACAPEDLTQYTPDNNANNVNNANNKEGTQFEQAALIMAKNCATSGCHVATSPFPPAIAGGVNATPAQVQAALENVKNNAGDKNLITPSDANASLIWLRISNTQPSIMPPGGAMPAADVKLIEDWINAGAKYEVTAANNNPGDMGGMDMSADMPATDMAIGNTFDDIYPLLQRCGSCHDGTSPDLPQFQGGVNATRAQIQAGLEDKMSALDPTVALVDMVYFRLAGDSKGTQMPKGASPWPQNEIDAYKAWLDNGANYQ